MFKICMNCENIRDIKYIIDITYILKEKPLILFYSSV